MAGGVPQIDFSILGNLGNTYKDAQLQAKAEHLQANRERTLAQLGQGADIKDVATQLFRAGDVQGGMSLAQLANAQAQQDWTKTYQGGMLNVAQRNAERQEVPAPLQILRAAGIDPASPEGRKALFPKTDTPISATDKKAIFAAEDDVPRLNATIRNVERAKELNPNVFTGITASLRGQIGTSNVPGANLLIDKDTAKATGEWDQLMGTEAIKNMSETLKGASTDFEMRKFIAIAADTTKPADVRERAMDRFLDLAKEEKALRENRVKGLKSGDYFKAGGDQPPPSAPSAATKPQAGPNADAVKAFRADPRAVIEEARAAVKNGADPNAVAARIGVNPAFLTGAQ